MKPDAQGGYPRGELRAKLVDLDDVNAFVRRFHRHHKPAHRGKVTLGVALRSSGQLVGVALLARPVARRADDGETLEVTRLATDGTPNACSFLLARARVIAAKMGARRLLTYTLPEEGGASLRAAGFVLAGEAGGGSWNRPSRPRKDTAPLQTKLRWEATCRQNHPSAGGRVRSVPAEVESMSKPAVLRVLSDGEDHAVEVDKDADGWFWECQERGCDLTGYGNATFDDAERNARRRHAE